MTQLNKILPVCAIAVGLALVGVTSAFTKVSDKHLDDLLSFQYAAPMVQDPYSQPNVQSKAHWEYTSTDPGCSTGDIKPCVIHVSPDYVQGTTPSNYALDSSFAITASSGTTSHVTGTSDGTAAEYITNRGNL